MFTCRMSKVEEFQGLYTVRINPKSVELFLENKNKHK